MAQPGINPSDFVGYDVQQAILAMGLNLGAGIPMAKEIRGLTPEQRRLKRKLFRKAQRKYRRKLSLQIARRMVKG